jgi:hypothetical protein
MAMAKKSDRQVPSMFVHVKGEGQTDIDELCENEMFVKAVFTETIAGIKEAINNKTKTATLFQLEKSDYYIELEKSQWKQALQTYIDKLIETEQYEECSKIKALIDKIK